MAKIICVDFDGVLHSYTSGWMGSDVVTDPPVPGAFEWLSSLVRDAGLRVLIYSSRSKDDGGVEAMKTWFSTWGFDPNLLEFPKEKPAAFLTVDDRAWLFKGEFPTLTQIHAFKSWVGR